jgi:hypothetical protein
VNPDFKHCQSPPETENTTNLAIILGVFKILRMVYGSDSEDEEGERPKGRKPQKNKKNDDSSDDMEDWR